MIYLIGHFAKLDGNKFFESSSSRIFQCQNCVPIVFCDKYTEETAKVENVLTLLHFDEGISRLSEFKPTHYIVNGAQEIYRGTFRHIDMLLELLAVFRSDTVESVVIPDNVLGKHIF